MSRTAVSITLLIAPLLGMIGVAAAQEDRSGLTPEKFRRDCLMCHSKAAPEGLSPEILDGLHPVPGLLPRDAMPTISCWRRCDQCFGPTPTARKAPGPAK